MVWDFLNSELDELEEEIKNIFNKSEENKN